MKTCFFISILLVSLCAGCIDEPVKKAPSTNAPVWSAGFPDIAHGAVSADLHFSTDIDSKVYWVIADKSLSLSPKEVKAEALKPRNPAIKFQGMEEVSGAEGAVTAVTSLQENTNYTVYMVAENTTEWVGDETVQQMAFRTHSRQDTLEYNSVAENRTVKYLLYRPEEVFKNPDKKYPIAFFLAGNGEVGTATTPIAVIHNGSLPEYIHLGNDVPMIVMSIQHIKEIWNNDLINEGIDHAIETYSVDENKMYLIGMSGGAFGAWHFAEKHPERLAALVAISGGGEPEEACNLKNMSVWAFHNRIDDVVNPGTSLNMIRALEACNPTHEVKLQLFPDPGHDCWRRVFDPNHADWARSPNIPRIKLYDWLLGQSRTTQ